MARKLVVEVVGDASSLEKALRTSDRAAKTWGRDMERTFRGAAAGTGVFRGLGRSVAFASSAFLGGVGFTAAITSTVKAAEEAQRVLGQTRVAVENSGQSWQRYREHIEDVSKATSQLSGFDDERLLGTFSNLVRRTGDVNRALQLNALAANVARGRNIELEAASQLVLKASLGNVGALRRLGIDIDKNASSIQALDLLQQKYAGSAAAYGRTAAGAQDRFRVALENLQETIGAQLLPIITRYANKAADWLNKTENQKRVANDLHDALQVLGTILNTVKGAFQALNDVTGSTKNSLKLLFGVLVAYKGLKLASSLTTIASNVGLIGTNAKTAAGQVGGLRGALGKLAGLGPIAIGVTVLFTAKWLSGTGPLKAVGGDYSGLDLFRDLRKALGFGDGSSRTSGFVRGYGTNLFAPPYGPLAPGRGGVGGLAAGGAGSAAAAGLPVLTAAQQRAIALAGNPTLAALRAQRDYDKAALAFLQKRFEAGKVSAKSYTDAVIRLKDDLAQQESAIAAMLEDAAHAAKHKSDETHKRVVKATGGLARGYLGAATGGGDPPTRLRATFEEPLRLQLAEARRAALGLSLRPVLIQMRAAARRALRSGKLSLQAQIDAWNAIASVNEQLAKQVTGFGPTGRVASSQALTAGIKFANAAARRTEEARIASLIAHGGRLAGGVSLQGQPVQVTTNVQLDGKTVATAVTHHQQQQVRHRAIQTSGPHAGRALQ